MSLRIRLSESCIFKYLATAYQLNWPQIDTRLQYNTYVVERVATLRGYCPQPRERSHHMILQHAGTETKPPDSEIRLLRIVRKAPESMKN